LVITNSPSASSETGLLNDHARIVISGSESARGDVPTFNPVDVEAFSSKRFNGDLEAAIEAQFRMSPPAEDKPANAYASAKLFVTSWATELAGRLQPDHATTTMAGR
jgi:hypothetical protein